MGSSTYDAKYYAQRKNLRSAFGYGLMRRIEQARRLVGEILDDFGDRSVHLVDLGCSDGAMLLDLAGRFAPRVTRATGIDIFPHGEVTSVDDKLQFIRHDLYRDFPYPLQDGSVDILMASAFFKHVPTPDLILDECVRVLAPGGVLIMLDPRPSIVKLGGLLGYFNLDYVPNLWSHDTLGHYAAVAREDLVLCRQDRYWSAPTARAHELGYESVFPPRWFGLHQSVVLRRSRKDSDTD